MQVSHGELVALLIAQKAVEQYRGTAFEKPLQSAFSKLAAGLQGESGIALHELTEAISFRPQGLATAELDGFQTLAEATSSTARSRSSIARSKEKKRGVASRATVSPRLHGEPMVFHWARPRPRRVRTFALARLQDVRDAGETFEKPRISRSRDVLGQLLGVPDREGRARRAADSMPLPRD